LALAVRFGIGGTSDHAGLWPFDEVVSQHSRQWLMFSIITARRRGEPQTEVKVPARSLRHGVA
jgi:hypothetical protein